MNVYELKTVREAAAAIRDHDHKQTVLHEGRIEAHRHMSDAIAQHEFMVKATERARKQGLSLQHRLESLVALEARTAIAGEATE